MSVDRDVLFERILAANDQLEAPALMDATCQAAADEIKERTVEEVRDYTSTWRTTTPRRRRRRRRRLPCASSTSGPYQFRSGHSMHA